jgi:hypothetical protein
MGKKNRILPAMACGRLQFRFLAVIFAVTQYSEKMKNKGIRFWLSALVLSGVVSVASGQITIRQQPEAQPSELELQPDRRLVAPTIEGLRYRTDAMAQAERRRRRHERNTFVFEAGLQATQVQFSNWAEGGDNNFNGLATLDLQHIYKKERLSLTTKFDARYGLNVIDTTTFKNQDRFNLNFQAAWSIGRAWSLSGMANLRSQFTRGYKSRKEAGVLVSDFMSPGVLDLSLGLTWKPEGSPWKVTLSPVTGSMLFVTNEELSQQGINSIEPGKHFKPMIGPSVMIDFDKKFAGDALRYRFNGYSFWNFRLEPVARWENWLTFQATKWLGTSIYWNMIYDREASVPWADRGKYLQINYSIGIGLTFRYSNK